MALLVLLVLVLAARAALPAVVEGQVRRRLAADPAWDATVLDVDVSVLRGAFALDGLRIARQGREQPLLLVDRVDVSVAWSALLDGALVAEVHLLRPEMELSPPAMPPLPAPADEAMGRRSVGGNALLPSAQAAEGVDTAGGPEPRGADWVALLERVVPFPVDRLVVEEGEVHFRDPEAQPAVDVWLHDIWVEATNLRNTLGLPEGLNARADGSARVMGMGQVVFHLATDPSARVPTFELDTEVRGVDMGRLSPLLAAYGGVEVGRGKLDLFAEITARDGQFNGYVKPVFAQIEGRRAPGGAPPRWTTLVGPDAGIPDTPTGRVPVTGLFDGAPGRPWVVVTDALRDAVVVALFRGLEGALALEQAASRAPRRTAEPTAEERREERRKKKKGKKRRGLFGRERVD